MMNIMEDKVKKTSNVDNTLFKLVKYLSAQSIS